MLQSRFFSLLRRDQRFSAQPEPMDVDPPETDEMPIHIQVLSDLHLEIGRPMAGGGYTTFDYDFPAKADILALLGDIGSTIDDRFFHWLRAQLRRFKLVFFLSGNHEAYRSSMASTQLHMCIRTVDWQPYAAPPGRSKQQTCCFCETKRRAGQVRIARPKLRPLRRT